MKLILIAFFISIYLVTGNASRLDAETIYLGCGHHNDDFPLSYSHEAGSCYMGKDRFYLQVKNNTVLEYLTPAGQRVWSRGLNIDDPIHFSEDGKQIFIIHWEVKPGDLCLTRFSILSVIDVKTGRTLKEIKLYDIRKKLFLEYSENPLERKRNQGNGPGYDCSFSLRPNSFYEIPENINSKEISFFKEGNYIVSFDRLDGFLIFDQSLSKIIYLKKLSDINSGSIRNAQVLRNGKVLFYNTVWREEGKSSVSIYLLDPAKDKSEKIFPKTLVSSRPFAFRVGKYQFKFSLIPFYEADENAELFDNLNVTELHPSQDAIYVQFNGRQNYKLNLNGDLIRNDTEDDRLAAFFQMADPPLLRKLWYRLFND